MMRPRSRMFKGERIYYLAEYEQLVTFECLGFGLVKVRNGRNVERGGDFLPEGALERLFRERDFSDHFIFIGEV